MNREDLRKMAEQVGLIEADSETIDRLLILRAEVEANVARLPKRQSGDEPAHVFFVPQRAPT